MVQPGAAPAEVEVLATGVGPGWAGATPAYGHRGMKELSRQPERGWLSASLRAEGGWEGTETSAVVAAGLERGMIGEL